MTADFCSGTTTTCPATVTRGATKFDWTHLWASQELGARKSALGARTAVLRERLKCAFNDGNVAFKAFAAFVLGYLGEDSGCRTFFADKLSGGSADDQAIAKAALLMCGTSADRATHRTAVTTASGRGTSTFANEIVSSMAAASPWMAFRDDAMVENIVLPRSLWKQPDEGPPGNPAGDFGRAFFASHLLALLSWEGRGWARNAGDTGTPSFFDSVIQDGNHPPDCASATVSPTSGEPPLTVVLDASGCTDADGHSLSFTWRVATSLTEEDVFDTPRVEHVLSQPGEYPITLRVVDSAPRPRETSRTFTVQVGGAGGASGDAVGSGCSCSAGGAGTGLAGLLVLTLLGLRRRRSWT